MALLQLPTSTTGLIRLIWRGGQVARDNNPLLVHIHVFKLIPSTFLKKLQREMLPMFVVRRRRMGFYIGSEVQIDDGELMEVFLSLHGRSVSSVKSRLAAELMRSLYRKTVSHISRLRAFNGWDD